MKFSDVPIGSWLTFKDAGNRFCLKINANEIAVFTNVGKLPIGDDADVDVFLTAIPDDE